MNIDIYAPDDFVQKRPKAKKDLEQELARKGKNTFNNWESKRTAALGAVGERLVRHYLGKMNENLIIEEALDPMDRTKDFIMKLMGDEYTAEVKTQSPYYNQGAFTVRENQIPKMKGVDYCFFVETPIVKTKDQWSFGEREHARLLGPHEASNYRARVYSYFNSKLLGKTIHTITSEFDIKDRRTGEIRKMHLVPIDKLKFEFEITEPKHLVMLDQYSTKPLGIIL